MWKEYISKMITNKALMSGNPMGLEICRHSQTIEFLNKSICICYGCFDYQVTSVIIISLIIPISGTPEERYFL